MNEKQMYTIRFKRNGTVITEYTSYCSNISSKRMTKNNVEYFILEGNTSITYIPIDIYMECHIIIETNSNRKDTLEF